MHAHRWSQGPVLAGPLNLLLMLPVRLCFQLYLCSDVDHRFHGCGQFSRRILFAFGTLFVHGAHFSPSSRFLCLCLLQVMPRMMSGMNPEELAEMQKMQSNFSLEGLKRNIEKK